MSLLGLSFRHTYGGHTGFWYFCRAALIALPILALVLSFLPRPA